jgi:hypothetical protein
MRIRSILPLAAFLALASCGSPPTHFYTLAPVPPAAPAPNGAPVTPPLEVGRVSIPDALDRDAIIEAAGHGQVDINGEQVWASDIDEMIRATLSQDLMARLPAGSVLPPGDTGSSAGLQVLVVNVLHFGGDTGGHVVLSAEWTTYRNDALTAPPPRPVLIRLQARSGAVADIVPVMSQALGQFADRIAQALRQ